MFILMHTGGMPFNGDTIPSGKSLGGSESAAYYMARELVKLGHKVTMFTNTDKPGMWDGVRYLECGEVSKESPLGANFHIGEKIPYDVAIVQRHPFAFSYFVHSKLNIWWLHDLALYRTYPFVFGQLFNIDQVFTVSEFHRQQVSTVYGIPENFITPTWNGLDYSEYQDLDHFEREPKSLIFASRPERGLAELVSGDECIMNKLPDCKLYVCGYDNTTKEMAGFYNYLWDRCKELPNVELLGHMGKRELAEKMAQCMLYVYPTMFEDTSCMMALEAFAAGLPFIAFKTAALPETTKDGGAILLDHNGEVNQKLFVKTIKRLLNHGGWKDLHERAKSKRQTWTDAAKQWETLFERLIRAKCDNRTRLYKHFEYYSDIVAIERDVERSLKTNREMKIPESVRENYKFYFDRDFAGHYERYYQYEKERGVTYGPENLDKQPRFEATVDAVNYFKPKTVLDFGCAHGHYTINLAKRFPDIEFVGIDLADSNIKIAEEWRNDERNKGTIGKVAFFTGDENYLSSMGSDHFRNLKWDLIVANEVLEHHPEPWTLVEKLKEYLNPNGGIVITVPYGPWESLGYKEHPGWRAHIHYLERADLQDLFGDQEDYKIAAIPHPPKPSFGHFLVTFRNCDEPIGRIDYTRKFNCQAPQETLSVCILVKNGEHSLGRTLKTIQDIADEIIIGIDETTTDETRRVAESFGAQCFDIKSPVEIGFDEARNETIKRAKMDWIFWIDTDETLEDSVQLPKYLRPNCFDGYAVKQHHYAAVPAAMFKTDIPVRLFRNKPGVRFFGVVHEHPEKAFNEGIGKVYLIEDIHIMHMGYSTEIVRKERFERNFPLMQRDREKYPDRKLGKFLWTRDLILYIRFLMSQNGNRITDEIIKLAKAVVFLWRDLLAMNEMRMAVEALGWYSLASQILTRERGIRFKINVDAMRLNGREFIDNPVEGFFMDMSDIESLTTKILKSKTHHFEDKYF